MAKRVFNCDLVTLSFASSDERNIIFLAADGPPLSCVPNCASICSHALLLEGESDIFCLPDMSQDWRFDRLFGKDGFHKELTYRFHASAPILLSCSETPCCKMPVSPVHAGRFSIFASEPRPNFDKKDAKILLDFARMTQEAMENEFLSQFAGKSRKLQRNSTRIIAGLNDSLEFRLRSDAVIRAVGSQMPGMGDLFPLMPTDRASTASPTSPSLGGTKPVYASILEDVDAMKPLLDMVCSSLSAKSACLIDGSSLSLIPRTAEGIIQESRRSSDLGNDEHRSDGDWISMIATAGDTSLVPQMNDKSTISSLESWFQMAKSDASRNRPQLLQRDQSTRIAPAKTSEGNSKDSIQIRKCPYGLHGIGPNSKDELPCCCILAVTEVVQLIEPILPDAVATCLVIPVVAENAVNLQKAPLAMMCITWDEVNAVSPIEIDFCSMLAIHLAGLACQEQASVISNGQLNLIRIMQHELRTPLNGIMGVSEALRDGSDDSFFGKETNAKWSTDLNLDQGMVARRSIGGGTSMPISVGAKNQSVNESIKAARVLAPQLESIHVSSMMLKTILDDILTLDNMFDGSSGARRQKPEMRNRESFKSFDFIEVIESACREELRYSDLQAMRIFRAMNSGLTATPSDKTDTPSSGVRNSSLAATAELMESAKTEEVGEKNAQDPSNPNTPTPIVTTPSNHSQPDILAGNMTMVNLPPTIIIKIDEKLTKNPVGNREKLRKIVGRLVSNAIRFTPHSGLVSVEIEISSSAHLTQHVVEIQKEVFLKNENGEGSTAICSLPGEGIELLQRVSQDTYWIQLKIKDSGIGMNEKFLQESYLKPFLKADDFSQGTGLGSTVAFAMIKSMGGAYTIQSRTEKGTEVNVFLPFAEKDSISNTVKFEDGIATNTNRKPEHKTVFTSAQFFGFESESGTKVIGEMLRSTLENHGLQCMDEEKRSLTETSKIDFKSSSQKKEYKLYIIHENALSASKAPLPADIGQSNVYSIVVARNALRLRPEPESMMLVKSGPHVLLIPPFGPSSWKMLDQLLQAPLDLGVSNSSYEIGQSQPITRSLTNLSQMSSPTEKQDHQATPSQAEKKEEDYFSQPTALKDVNQAQSASPISSLSTPRANMTSLRSEMKKENNVTSESPAIVKAMKTPKSFCVLAVEDNPINMRLLTGILRKLKMPFTEARDGVEAVEKFKSYKPSVVLLDISLPLMDGFDACIAMREHNLPIRPIIIAITALSTPQDKDRGLKICGMDEWQTKPVSINMLKAKLTEWRKEHEEKAKNQAG